MVCGVLRTPYQASKMQSDLQYNEAKVVISLNRLMQSQSMRSPQGLGALSHSFMPCRLIRLHIDMS